MAVTLAHWTARKHPASAPEVYSISEMVEQMKKDRADNIETTTPQTRPDGSVFTSF
jgi:hypothetical protein